MNDNYKNAFLVIADLWPNFKQPETVIGIGIWDRALSQHSERAIMTAIETLYHREHFFSFGKLMEILNGLSKPKHLPKADVLAIVDKLSTNSRQDISDQPEIVRETIRQAGGLAHLGSKEWDEWTMKKVGEAYDDALRNIEQVEMQMLTSPERLAIE